MVYLLGYFALTEKKYPMTVPSLRMLLQGGGNIVPGITIIPALSFLSLGDQVLKGPGPRFLRLFRGGGGFMR